MKRSLIAFAAAALLAVAGPAAAAPATGTPYEITVILPSTGSGKVCQTRMFRQIMSPSRPYMM